MAATLCNPRYRRSAKASNTPASYQAQRRFTRDMVFGGDGQFANPPNDPITLDGVPYQTRLRVWDERTGILVRETWSAADGTWTIRHLNRDRSYLVVCYDATYPALAYDRQTPDVMP